MNRTLALVLAAAPALSALVACPSTVVTPAAVVPAGLTVGVVRSTSTGGEPLLIGSSWSKGDEVAVEVKSEADAVLYVVLVTAGGAQKVVAPTEEGKTIELKKGQATRVPLDGWASITGSCPGTDRLFVVASQRPLTLADTVLYNAIDRMRRFKIRGKSCGSAPAPQADAYETLGNAQAGGGETVGGGAGGAGGGPDGARVPVGGGVAAPVLPGLAPVVPLPPPPPSTGAGIAADLALFTGRSSCLGRPECSETRALRSAGSSYVGMYDDLGIAVIELSFEHE